MICSIWNLLFGLRRIRDRGGVCPIAPMLQAGRKGVRNPAGDFISKHFPNGSAHPASTSIRTRAPSWVQSGRSVTLTTHLPFTVVWDSLDMGKTPYRNVYIFIITRQVLNNFSVRIQSWQIQQHIRLHISKYFIHLSRANRLFSRQLYPGSNPAAHSVGVGRARRAQKAPVYWMELGLPFMTPRVNANCSEPLPCHRKYSTSDQQTVLVYLQVSIILWIYRTRKCITVFTTNLYTE